jgi:polyphosphate kinase
MAEVATGTINISNLEDPALYINRDLGLIEFQRRVLEEAQDPANPLLERVKFLSILFSNLDEFFMVRVAHLQQQVERKATDVGPDGTSASETLELIRSRIVELLGETYRLFNEELQPALAQAGIHLLRYADLNEEQKRFAKDYFQNTVFPVLTPLGFDPGRPFPHISNLSLSIGVVVKKPRGQEHFGRVKVPETLGQLLRLPDSGHGSESFVWLDEVIEAHLQPLFAGMEIKASSPFHVTRDAEVAIQELESDDLLETIEEAILSRRFRDVVRLQVHNDIPQNMLEVLETNLKVVPEELYRVSGPIDLGRLKYLSVDRPELKDPPFIPASNALKHTTKEGIFARIAHSEILLHHPYESFQPVLDFFRQAAHDPDVLAIKTTLYRVGKNSPVVQALLDAALNGKQVAALVELKARFDEESNIGWARALESQGVHVVYGLVGLKVHSKISMVVRREGNRIRRYMHLGTGNYNAGTARLYTDFGFFTDDEEIGSDATDLFNYLTGYAAETHFRKLLIAPFNMRQRLVELIEREIEHSKRGGEAHLIFEMNSLEDPGMMETFYSASQAGVKIDLLVRGLCCLRPELPGVSENIRVLSIVGRYLEHSRAYYFRNGGKEEIYLGSADLMPRNLNRRVEVLFPISNRHLLQRIKKEILETYLRDTARARLMHSDGTYSRLREAADVTAFDSQKWFMAQHSTVPGMVS